MDFLLAADFTQLQFSVGTVNKYLQKLPVRPSNRTKKNYLLGLLLNHE